MNGQNIVHVLRKVEDKREAGYEIVNRDVAVASELCLRRLFRGVVWVAKRGGVACETDVQPVQEDRSC